MAATDRLASLVRSRPGRMLVGGLGIGLVAWLVVHEGLEQVSDALTHGALALPVVFALDGLYNVLELLALRELYGADRAKIPTSELLRAGLVAYALGRVMPMGRPVVESVRAVALSRWTSAPRAAAAGARLATMLLLSQALLALPCAVATAAAGAPWILSLAITVNGVVTALMGTALHLATHRGTALAARAPRVAARLAAFAPAFDEHLREEGSAGRAWALILAGRGVQASMFAVLLLALSGRAGTLRTLVSVGAQMVGSSVADVLLTHLGGTEALAPLVASSLSLSPSDALAIPLIVHAEQAVWIVIGFAALALLRPASS